MTFIVMQSTSTSYASGDFETHTEAFDGAGTFATLDEAALFALACDEDGGVDFTAEEIDFPGDVTRRVVSFWAMAAAEWAEVVEAERRDREEALAPFGAEWYREQMEGGW